LHKRSKQKWLLQGDKQYRIFPQIYQCEKKKEYDLPDGEGRQYTLQKEEDILEHATEYYKTLFGPSEKKPLFDLDPDCWKHEEKVTEEENEALTKPFSLEELRVAIFTMETNTAPGPDHIPVEFYQKSRKSIKLDLFDMLNEFWGHKLDLGRLNYGIITMIPKMKEANKIQ
jgi:hypothetical protein